MLRSLFRRDRHRPCSRRFSDLSVDEAVCLGEGNFATVLKARRRVNGEKLAVKKVAMRQTSPRQMAREAELMERSAHPNVLALVRLFTQKQGFSYLFMDLCQGGDLQERLAIDVILPEATAAHLAQQLFSAVAHIHFQGIGHFDLKLENLLLFDAGPLSTAQLKVCDFGVAQDVSGLQRAPSVCTPSYAAPEALDCRRVEDSRAADLWSCGVILYACLVGELPFDGLTAPDATELRRVFAAPNITVLTKSAQGLITRLLRLDPPVRYTAEQSKMYPWVARKAPEGTEVDVPLALLQVLLSDEQAAALRQTIAQPAFASLLLPWELEEALSLCGCPFDICLMNELKYMVSQSNGLLECTRLYETQRWQAHVAHAIADLGGMFIRIGTDIGASFFTPRNPAVVSGTRIAGAECVARGIPTPVLGESTEFVAI